MQIERKTFKSLDGKDVPAFSLRTKSEKSLVLIHGFASSKDETLGIAYKIAERGYDVFAIDLRGHGDNENEFDENVLEDVEGVITELRKSYENVFTFGHSLGGLLSLKSSSDFAFAVSPPLMTKVVSEVEFMLLVHACKVKDGAAIFEILKKLNPPERRENAIVFYGKGESDALKTMIKKWAEGRDVRIVELEDKQASLPQTQVDAEKLKLYIPRFVSHQAVIHSRRLFEFL
ncbi:MAG: alpha/beta fold hydrolase [Archaeoglobaceae archaeon]